MKLINKILFLLSTLLSPMLLATDYHIGPSQALTKISDAPWATLQAGDNVYIHWRPLPYKEKWVINRNGTALAPISIIGVSNNMGEQPIIDGNDAVTVNGVNFWNETRGVIKIGGSNTPIDGLPEYIIIDNLDIRSARPAYKFTDVAGNIQTYSNNAASIYVEKATHLIIRNCTIHDSGNGLFIGAFDGKTEDILIEKNHIYDNGIVDQIYEHNTYSAAIDITYQFNHFGPLKIGARGNNLKDRSAGLKVRYNWIESGNRQLDMVDAEDSAVLVNHPSYSETFVYGNILIEPDGAGNSQMLHYGGDSGVTGDYRKGHLYVFNNTIISTRSANTTLIRLSTNDETAHVFNNIIYNTARGSNMALISGNGTLNLNNNWLPINWRDCHCTANGVIKDNGNNIEGSAPMFNNLSEQNYTLQSNSEAIDSGSALLAAVLPSYNIDFHYIKHQNTEARPIENTIDMGAYEFCDAKGCELLFKNSFE